MQLLFYFLVAAAAAVLDQIAKYYTVAGIPLYTHVEVLPGVVGLTYVRNTGAAFSSFEGMQWLFALIFVIFTAALLGEDALHEIARELMRLGDMNGLREAAPFL